MFTSLALFIDENIVGVRIGRRIEINLYSLSFGHKSATEWQKWFFFSLDSIIYAKYYKYKYKYKYNVIIVAVGNNTK